MNMNVLSDEGGGSGWREKEIMMMDRGGPFDWGLFML